MQRIVRFQADKEIVFGAVEGEAIHEMEGGLFGVRKPGGRQFRLADVKLLYPCVPGQILAVGLNYKSHLGERKMPSEPEVFLKALSSLQNPGDPIVTPRDSVNMHFEGELVAVMGLNSKVFGVTCGNDVSERNWQHGPNKDMQWWRAKGADTFGPMGPAIVTGLDYGKLTLETRVNEKIVQRQSTSDLIFNLETIIEWIGRWVTLRPGDVIFTGTPGATSKLNPGDVVEVEIEKVGLLSNPVI